MAMLKKAGTELDNDKFITIGKKSVAYILRM